jgi:hypothetical protein
MTVAAVAALALALAEAVVVVVIAVAVATSATVAVMAVGEVKVVVIIAGRGCVEPIASSSFDSAFTTTVELPCICTPIGARAGACTHSGVGNAAGTVASS